jgi:hypothetical protein
VLITEDRDFGELVYARRRPSVAVVFRQVPEPGAASQAGGGWTGLVAILSYTGSSIDFFPV